MHRSPLQRFRQSLTGMLVVIMLTASVAMPVSAAAQQQSYVSQLTGATITYSPPYQLLPELVYADENMEMVAFSGSADILAMGFLPALIDLNGARDVFLSGLFGEFEAIVNLDSGSYDGVSYSLDMANVDGTEMGVFSLFMNNRSHGFAEYAIFIAPPLMFGPAMQAMQNSIAINGVGLMQGVNATVMGDLVVANIGTTGGTAATNVTDVQQNTEVQNTTSTTTDTVSRDEYLGLIQAEFSFYTEQLSIIFDTTDQLSAQTITAQDARPIMDAAHAALATSNDRAAAIAVPAGMESFHTQFLAAAGAMTQMGVAWQDFVTGNITAEDYANVTSESIAAYSNFATALDNELNATATDPQTTTTETTNTTQTTSVGRDEYLGLVQAEFAFYTIHLTTILTLTEQLGDGTVTAEAARPILDDAHAQLATANDRAAAIIPPAGMEAFHSQFLDTANSITSMGVAWQNFIGGNTPVEDYTAQLTATMTAYSNFAAVLENEMNSSGTDSSTTQTTAGTENADASQYLAAVQAQVDAFHESFTNFTVNLGGFGEATTDAQKQEHLQVTVDEATSWITYLDTANSLTPPPGYEGVHAAYIAWATEVTSLGNTWMGFLQQEGPTTEDFSVQIDNVETAEDALTSELAAAGSTQSGDTGSTGTNTDTTETTTQSGRTTRGTTADVTPEPTEETTTRSGRTTRGTTTDVTPEPTTETSSRTGRTTRGTDATQTDDALTNISETKGTRGTSTGQTTSTSVNEWLTPQFDVLIEWSDAISLYEGQNGSTNSDTANGLDQISLEWGDADGNTALVLITVMSGQPGDPEFVAEALAGDPASVEEYFGAGAELVDYSVRDNASGMLVHIVSDTSTGWLYTQFTCLDDDCTQLVRIQVVANGDSMPAALQDLRTSLTADGVSISDAMRSRSIQTAIDGFGN